MKRSPQGRWAFGLSFRPQGRSFDLSLRADCTQRKVVTFRKLISLLMALQNKALRPVFTLESDPVHCLAVFQQIKNECVMFICKAQRLCAEFVENFILQTVEAFVGSHAMSFQRPSGTGSAHVCWPTRRMDKEGQLVLEMQMSDDLVNHGLALSRTI